MKRINLYPGFVQNELVKNVEGENFENERSKGRAATWCAARGARGAGRAAAAR